MIGHELGHIRSGHAPFQLAQLFVPQLADLLGQMTMGIGGLVGAGVEVALFDWYRKSELTCDRCGLLLCQNSDAALSMLMKLGGAPPALYREMNFDAFLEQATALDRLDQSGLARAYKLFVTAFGKMDHPWLAVRARELVRWVQSGAYGELIQVASPSGSVCPKCATPHGSHDRFCSGCGGTILR